MRTFGALPLGLLASSLLIAGTCGSERSGLSDSRSHGDSNSCADSENPPVSDKVSDEISTIVAAYWQKIRATSEESPAEGDESGLQEYWAGIGIGCYAQFTAMLAASKDERAVIESFVSKFGRNGAEADMRWILCSRGCTLDMHRVGLVGPEDGGVNEIWRKRQLLVAEFQTRRFLNDRKALDQYLHCVIWANWIFHPEWFQFHVHKTGIGIDRESEYWWYARTFVLMSYATGRDDLLKGVKPENLADRFREWREWMESDGPFLRPNAKGYGWSIDMKAKDNGDLYEPFVKSRELPLLKKLPETPFPDWKGPPPMPPKLLRRM